MSSSQEAALASDEVRDDRTLTVASDEGNASEAVEVLGGIYVRLVKPIFDRVVGLVLTLLLLPIVVVVAIAVRVSLGSPVIFRQRRVGRDGREFDVYKFRTMRQDRRRSHAHRGRGPAPDAQERERPAPHPRRAARCASGASTSCRSSGTCSGAT